MKHSKGQEMVARPLLIIGMLLAMVFSATAAPPTFEVFEGDLQIISAHSQILRFESGVELYFHIYNSTGVWLNTTNANCTIHTYNKTNGQHLAEEQLLTHSTTEWEFKVNISKYGKSTYDYIVYCHTNGMTPPQWGHLRNSFTLTTTGETISYEAFTIAALFILLPLLAAWLLLTWALALGEDHDVLKIFMSIFSIFSIMFSYAMSINTLNKFFEWSELEGTLSTQTTMFAWMAFIVITYWSIYLIRKAFDAAAKQRFERLRY